MKKHCRFCGGKIFADAIECEHCGKALVAKREPDDGAKLTNINSWEGQTVPAWVMYMVIGFGLLMLFLFLVQDWFDPALPQE